LMTGMRARTSSANKDPGTVVGGTVIGRVVVAADVVAVEIVVVIDELVVVVDGAVVDVGVDPTVSSVMLESTGVAVDEAVIDSLLSGLSPTAAPMPTSAMNAAPPYALQRCQRGGPGSVATRLASSVGSADRVVAADRLAVTSRRAQFDGERDGRPTCSTDG
jgi:hypothetical protein